MMSSALSLLTHDPQIIFRQLCGNGNTSSVLLHVHGAGGRWGALAPWWARVWTQNPPELIYGFLVFFYDIDRRLSFTRRPNSACFILRRLTGAHGHSLNQSLFLTLHPATVWLKKAANQTRIIRHAAEITGTSFQNFYSGAVCVTPPQLQSPSDQKKAELTRTLLFLFLTSLCTRVLLIFTSVSCFHLVPFEPRPKVVICLHVIDNKASWILNPAQPKRKLKKQHCKPLLQAVFF